MLFEADNNSKLENSTAWFTVQNGFGHYDFRAGGSHEVLTSKGNKALIKFSRKADYIFVDLEISKIVTRSIQEGAFKSYPSLKLALKTPARYPLEHYKGYPFNSPFINIFGENLLEALSELGITSGEIFDSLEGLLLTAEGHFYTLMAQEEEQKKISWAKG